MTANLLANLLADCLRHPDDPVRRLVLADAYLDAGKVKHAGLVRATAGSSWRWLAWDIFEFGGGMSRCPEVVFRHDWVERRRSWGIATAHSTVCRQPWMWHVRCRPTDAMVVQGDRGASPNRHNAMWRALKALLQHRRRHCICEGWKNEETR